jgi:hypothetical protein
MHATFMISEKLFDIIRSNFLFMYGWEGGHHKQISLIGAAVDSISGFGERMG